MYNESAMGKDGLPIAKSVIRRMIINAVGIDVSKCHLFRNQFLR